MNQQTYKKGKSILKEAESYGIIVNLFLAVIVIFYLMNSKRFFLAENFLQFYG